MTSILLDDSSFLMFHLPSHILILRKNQYKTPGIPHRLWQQMTFDFAQTKTVQGISNCKTFDVSKIASKHISKDIRGRICIYLQ